MIDDLTPEALQKLKESLFEKARLGMNTEQLVGIQLGKLVAIIDQAQAATYWRTQATEFSAARAIDQVARLLERAGVVRVQLWAMTKKIRTVVIARHTHEHIEVFRVALRDALHELHQTTPVPLSDVIKFKEPPP